ncbi:MAG: hypothetical protein ABF623_12665 [Gluconobacter cerinus]|uniref:hypothetical protein n=1 Tax=Gluconobacter cerinus TaxID=38307 RepID=UPI0039EBC625
MAVSRAASGSMPGFAEIIGKGELCLLAVAFSAVGLGEIQGVNIKDENKEIALTGFSTINIILSISLYVMMRSSINPLTMQIVTSIIFFVSTLVVSTSCIAVSEVADV